MAQGFDLCPSLQTVCSFASPSPAVGLLCDGACGKGIGGTFHTLGAAWWGVGSGLMNEVHLAERRGPQDSLVQTWFTDQRGVIPASSSHSFLLLLLCLLLLGVLVVVSVESLQLLLPRGCFLWFFDNLQSVPHVTRLILAPMLELPVSPDAHGEPWSPGCGIFWLISSAQSSGAACRFLPAKFINPASGSDCEVIRETGLQPSDPAVTLFSVKWDEEEGGEEEQGGRKMGVLIKLADGFWSSQIWTAG